MKKLLIVGLAILLTLSVLSPVQAASDITEDDRFYDEMTYLIEQGILTGYPDGTYRPEQLVTRAEAAILIGRMLDFAGGQAETAFPDVYSSMKASGYIAQGAEAGIINGFENGTFRPDAAVTRGSMAIFLARALDLGSNAPLFPDVGPNMNAFSAIGGLHSQFIAAGYPDGTFRPLEEITRGQMAAFLARTLEPRFKNEARMPGSFVPDMTKAYTYQSDSGTRVNTYELANPSPEMMDETFMWVSRGADSTSYYYKLEDSRGLFTAIPFSEVLTDLLYPVEEGRSFTFYNGQFEEETRTYTGIGVTVETPYKTFTDAVEVTHPDGHKSYYVQGYGFVKSVTADGTVMSQLINVE